MADYGSSTDLGYLLTSIADSVSADQKAYGLESATTWVNSIVGVITGTVPDLVEKAATYYAYAFLLRMLYDTSFEDSSSAMKFEKMAIELLAAYSAQNPDEEDLTNPYSSSKTPTKVEMNKNKRTTYDDTDYDNVDDTLWTVDD